MNTEKNANKARSICISKRRLYTTSSFCRNEENKSSYGIEYEAVVTKQYLKNKETCIQNTFVSVNSIDQNTKIYFVKELVVEHRHIFL